jgi:hypothetical protein
VPLPAPGDPTAEVVAVPAALFTPTRPGALLRAARDRGLPVS